jgi:hypothetical protein
MKKLIIEIPKECINLNSLQGNEIIAYKCKSEHDSHAILVNIKMTVNADNRIYGYGFIPMNSSNSNIRYKSSTWREAIEAAISGGRTLFVFESEKDLAKAILNNQF